MSTLKTQQASKAVRGTKAKAKLAQVQEQRLSKLGGIEGDWLVLGDKSGSMEDSIVKARQVASLIAQQVKGQVYLVFFDIEPTLYRVGGKSLEEIEDLTRYIYANGGTSIGVGLDLLLQKDILINGIAIVSDGGENRSPQFWEVYRKYCGKFGIEPPIYHFWLPGDPNALEEDLQGAGILFEGFDVSNVDYYSLPQIIKLLRTSRYTLVEEILETPLLRFSDVFKPKEAML
jgi:hypothetical protein